MVAVATPCKRWDCEACRKAKAKRLRALLKQVRWGSFLTLTMPPALGTPGLANLLRQGRALKHFLQWVRRKILTAFGERALDKFHYAWVREVGARGQRRLHLHMLWTAPYLAQAELAQAAERCGLGQRLDIRTVKSQQQIGEYCAKVTHYLTKGEQAEMPRGTRHYAVSAPVERPGKDPDWRWSALNVHMVAWYVFGAQCDRVEGMVPVLWTERAGITWQGSS
jgi:hypothetical protein